MLSKTSVLALKAMAILVKIPPKSFSGATVIATQINAPKNYLGKILQLLSREGLVVSQKGMGGGFQLARDPRKIFLIEIVDSIDHVFRKAGCILGNGVCSDDKACQMHEKWKAVKAPYFNFLTQTTIYEFAGKTEFHLS